jgi:hypothetical protein
MARLGPAMTEITGLSPGMTKKKARQRERIVL